MIYRATKSSVSRSATSGLWKRGVVVLLVSLIVACDMNAVKTSEEQEVFHVDQGAKAYTHLNFQNNPNNFQFAVVGDRTGGHRPGVFSGESMFLTCCSPSSS